MSSGYRCVAAVCLLLLGGCAGLPAAGSPTAAAQPTPTATPVPPTATEQLTATTTPVPPTATEQATPSATREPPAATEQPTELPTATTAPQPSVQPVEARHVFPVQAAEGTINYGRVHHDYPATDIFCPIGSVFVAPIGGVIDYVSREDVWEPASDRPADRGGLSIALIGDDGVRYYGSHLSQIDAGIERGVRVEAGQPLGLTGKSGNARSTPPHLHFGISHPTTPDDWQVRRGEVSPYPYLRAWQRGEDLTPDLEGDQ
ncbi:MAG TPA: M23 family metallopeptidase [Roseiflexaceae bacterium]|nr:M23 family metallopeptidase [Roseiflexaceae bacterium]